MVGVSCGTMVGVGGGVLGVYRMVGNRQLMWLVGEGFAG